MVDAHYRDYEIEQTILAPLGARIEVVTTGGDAARLQRAVRHAEAVMVREAPVDARTIASMERCRVIVRYGVGVDNIDLAAARDRRIFVANVPDYGTDDVAEHTLALILAVYRRVAQFDRAIRRGRWLPDDNRIYRLRGKALGIVGFGRIGRSLWTKCQGLGLERCLVYDPLVADDVEGVERVDLDALCREVDIVTLHAPLTPQTTHLIDARRLALLKPTAVLVNTARGRLVDEDALVKALRERRLLGAGLDVYGQEPVPADHPVMSLDNVVLTPHIAWYSEESMVDLKTKAAQEVARVLTGQAPLHWVNRWEE
ncbi:MAG: C-terminal binding protein [Firmicutes bacterium]|nr:C-terminal binding protein [Bacillota bacterium]